MAVRTHPMLGAIAALMLVLAAASSLAQTAAPATTTRLLVTTYRLKPDRVETWLKLQQTEVLPALKKAGVTERRVYETVVGEATEFVSVTPLESFAAFNGPGPIERALGPAATRDLETRLGECILTVHRRIENSRDDFFLDPGDAAAQFASKYRALPGKSGAYMTFFRDRMMPVMREAQENGTFAGLEVTVSGHGGEWGLITLNMYYHDFAPLDGEPPVAKTLGPEKTRELLAAGAGLIDPIEWILRRRVAEISF